MMEDDDMLHVEDEDEEYGGDLVFEDTSRMSMLKREDSTQSKPLLAAKVLLGLFLALLVVFLLANFGLDVSGHSLFKDTQSTSEFFLSERVWATEGENRYWGPLRAGYTTVLVSKDLKRKLVTTILVEKHAIGDVLTRAYEETEFTNSLRSKQTISYIAIDANTSSIFKFGEETYTMKNEQWSLESSWTANVSTGSHAGMLMPGEFLLGSRFYHEWAPQAGATNTGTIVSLSGAVTTPKGAFSNCLVMNDGNGAQKIFAAGVGCVSVGGLELTEYGGDIKSI